MVLVWLRYPILLFDQGSSDHVLGHYFSQTNHKWSNDVIILVIQDHFHPKFKKAVSGGHLVKINFSNKDSRTMKTDAISATLTRRIPNLTVFQ